MLKKITIILIFTAILTACQSAQVKQVESSKQAEPCLSQATWKYDQDEWGIQVCGRFYPIPQQIIERSSFI